MIRFTFCPDCFTLFRNQSGLASFSLAGKPEVSEHLIAFDITHQALRFCYLSSRHHLPIEATRGGEEKRGNSFVTAPLYVVPPFYLYFHSIIFLQSETPLL